MMLLKVLIVVAVRFQAFVMVGKKQLIIYILNLYRRNNEKLVYRIKCD